MPGVRKDRDDRDSRKAGTLEPEDPVVLLRGVAGLESVGVGFRPVLDDPKGDGVLEGKDFQEATGSVDRPASLAAGGDSRVIMD